LSHAVYAAFDTCRADPIIVLSNGAEIRIAATVGTAADNVRQISYLLHAPIGTSITQLVYTGGPLANKEQVAFAADLHPDHYLVDTIVDTQTTGITVTTTVVIGEDKQSASGLSQQHLFLYFPTGSLPFVTYLPILRTPMNP